MEGPSSFSLRPHRSGESLVDGVLYYNPRDMDGDAMSELLECMRSAEFSHGGALVRGIPEPELMTTAGATYIGTAAIKAFLTGPAQPA